MSDLITPAEHTLEDELADLFSQAFRMLLRLTYAATHPGADQPQSLERDYDNAAYVLGTRLANDGPEIDRPRLAGALNRGQLTAVLLGLSEHCEKAFPAAAEAAMAAREDTARTARAQADTEAEADPWAGVRA